MARATVRVIPDLDLSNGPRTPTARAAAEIVALVNSRPASPRQDEIERILAKCGPAKLAPSPALLDWNAVVVRFMQETTGNDCDDAYQRASGPFIEAAKAIWGKPAQSWDDIVLRAAIAIHWNSPGNIGDPSYPDCILREGPDTTSLDDYSVAQVVRGILDVAGLAFDPDGRLLLSTCLAGSNEERAAVPTSGNSGEARHG